MPIDDTQLQPYVKAVEDADAVLTTKKQALTDTTARQGEVDTANMNLQTAQVASSNASAAFGPVQSDYRAYINSNTTPYATDDSAARYAVYATAGDLMVTTAATTAAAQSAYDAAVAANVAPTVADATTTRDAQKQIVDAAKLALDNYIAANE